MNWNRLREFFRTYDEDEIAAFRHKVPNDITVNIVRDNDEYIARVEKIDNQPVGKKTIIITGSDSFEGLVYEVNDIVFAYLNFPIKVRSKMPQLLPSNLEKQLSHLKKTSQKNIVFAK